MKNHENLNGELVLIDPQLKDDLSRKQGKVGFVTYARDDHDITVGFTNGDEAVYNGKDLYQLKSKDQLMQVLNDHGAKMDVNDFKTMFKMMMLADKGTSTARFNALELAAKSPAIWDKVLTRAIPERELEIAKGYGR